MIFLVVFFDSEGYMNDYVTESILCVKVMLDTPEEVGVILSGKLALKYSGSDLEAMKAIAEAAKKRSLADFNQVTDL